MSVHFVATRATSADGCSPWWMEACIQCSCPRRAICCCYPVDGFYKEAGTVPCTCRLFELISQLPTGVRCLKPDLSRAPYVVYGVKYIDLVSLKEAGTVLDANAIVPLNKSMALCRVLSPESIYY